MWSRKLRVLVSKMVGSGHSLIGLRVVRSKLRKREETNNNSLGHGQQRALPALPALPAHQLQQLQLQTTDSSKVAYNQGHVVETTAVTVAVNTTTTTTTAAPAVAATVVCPEVPPPCHDDVDGVDGKAPPLELFLWSYPSHGQQLSAFNGTKDTLVVREVPCEVPQDSKGLRKNLRGKWKRLVKKKPEDSCSIPPELRDQLKQIYVY